MSQTDLREAGISSDAGKTAVIVITVVFSCLFFTLGFFVGRAGTPQSPEPATPPQVVSAPAQAGAPAITPQPQPETPAVQQVSPGTPVSKEEAPSQQKPVVRPQPEARPAQIVNAVSESSAKPEKETPKPAAKPTQQEQVNAKEEKTSPVFTVQVGAFKSKAEAERFRSKYAKKGYKIYLSTVKADRRVKIYKVRTGEFSERKDAELLAIRLKKTEGLNAFVANIKE